MSRGRPWRRVFLFSPQGGQWPGMGALLYAGEPVFRRVIDACDREIQAQLSWSLVAEVQSGRPERLVRDPYYVQPALTAVQMGLSALLRAQGAEPDAVGGLSMGEVAAAHAAEVLTLPEAMRVVCVQARLTRREQPQGRMGFAALSRTELARRLRGRKGRVWLAVELAPAMTVVSGDSSDVAGLVDDLRGDGIRAGMVPVGFGFHSQVVDAIGGEFRAALRGLRPRKARRPILSAVLSRGARPSFGVAHWWAIMRKPASLPRLVNALLDRGASQLVEVGPEPVLEDPLRAIIADGGADASVSASLRRSAATAGDLAGLARSLTAAPARAKRRRRDG